MSLVTIKGSKDGLTAYINYGNYEDIKNELLKKLEQSKSFFSGSNMLIIDQAKLTPDNYTELTELLKNSYSIITKFENNEVTEKAEKIFAGINEGKTKFYKSSIRSGQRINYAGNVVVIGDVNSGAEIIAAGNIIIMGVLRGIAHAGCTGNMGAFVTAYILQPSILRIADIIVRAPDDMYEKPKTPEIAMIKDNTIIVEPYSPNKYI